MAEHRDPISVDATVLEELLQALLEVAARKDALRAWPRDNPPEQDPPVQARRDDDGTLGVFRFFTIVEARGEESLGHDPVRELTAEEARARLDGIEGQLTPGDEIGVELPLGRLAAIALADVDATRQGEDRTVRGHLLPARIVEMLGDEELAQAVTARLSSLRGPPPHVPLRRLVTDYGGEAVEWTAVCAGDPGELVVLVTRGDEHKLVVVPSATSAAGHASLLRALAPQPGERSLWRFLEVEGPALLCGNEGALWSEEIRPASAPSPMSSSTGESAEEPSGMPDEASTAASPDEASALSSDQASPSGGESDEPASEMSIAVSSSDMSSDMSNDMSIEVSSEVSSGDRSSGASSSQASSADASDAPSIEASSSEAAASHVSSDGSSEPANDDGVGAPLEEHSERWGRRLSLEVKGITISRDPTVYGVARVRARLLFWQDDKIVEEAEALVGLPVDLSRLVDEPWPEGEALTRVVEAAAAFRQRLARRLSALVDARQPTVADVLAGAAFLRVLARAAAGAELVPAEGEGGAEPANLREVGDGPEDEIGVRVADVGVLVLNPGDDSVKLRTGDRDLDLFVDGALADGDPEAWRAFTAVFAQALADAELDVELAFPAEDSDDPDAVETVMLSSWLLSLGEREDGDLRWPARAHAAESAAALHLLVDRFVDPGPHGDKDRTPRR